MVDRISNIKIIKYIEPALKKAVHTAKHACRDGAPRDRVKLRIILHLPDRMTSCHMSVRSRTSVVDIGHARRIETHRRISLSLSSLISCTTAELLFVCSSCLSPLSSLPRVRPPFNAHAYDICAWYGSTLAQVPRCAALPRAPLNRRRSCAPRSRVRAPPTKLPLRRLSQSPPPPPPRPSPRVW